jgi:hypothetical protein
VELEIISGPKLTHPFVSAHVEEDRQPCDKERIHKAELHCRPSHVPEGVPHNLDRTAALPFVLDDTRPTLHVSRLPKNTSEYRIKQDWTKQTKACASPMSAVLRRTRHVSSSHPDYMIDEVSLFLYSSPASLLPRPSFHSSPPMLTTSCLIHPYNSPSIVLKMSIYLFINGHATPFSLVLFNSSPNLFGCTGTTPDRNDLRNQNTCAPPLPHPSRPSNASPTVIHLIKYTVLRPRLYLATPAFQLPRTPCPSHRHFS